MIPDAKILVISDSYSVDNLIAMWNEAPPVSNVSGMTHVYIFFSDTQYPWQALVMYFRGVCYDRKYTVVRRSTLRMYIAEEHRGDL